ncbi:MAG: M14 family zinc carboxypeptidase [Candidatus Thermoplasmatota archaeon]
MKWKDVFFVLGLVAILSFSGISVAFAGSDTRSDDNDSASALLDENFPDPENDLEDYPFPQEYPSVDALYNWYDDLAANYSNLVQKHHYGTSWEGRDLWALEITSNDTQVEEKSSVLIDGGIHAREWSGPQVASYYMWRILDGYDSNETIHWLVNNRRIFVVPMTNPDGYIYDGDGNLGESASWRKNRNDSTPTDAVGVDLNRNWDIAWEQGDDDPTSSTYHGESPFSEYETYQLRDFMIDNDVDSYHNIHSYAGTLLIPNMYTSDPSPHDDWYRGTADHMTSLTSIMGDETQDYSYGQPAEEIGYSAPGGAADWAYHDMGAQGVSFELATSSDGRGGFYPPEEDIMTINQDVDDSLIYQTRVADTDLGDGENLLYPPVPYLLFGNVEDDMGNPVTNAEVEVESQVTGENLTIDTDSNGYYEFNFGNLVENGYNVTDDFTVGVTQDPGSQVNFSVDDTWGKRIDLQSSPATSVRTTGAFQITADSAELTGNVTLAGVNSVDAYFEYRIEGDPNWQTTASQNITANGEYSQVVDGLNPNTTYEFRAVIEWDGGSEEDRGEILSFRTLEPTLYPPTSLRVEKDEDTGDVMLEWDDVGSQEYNVYYSEDQYSEFDTWDNIATIGETTYTHENALGGENYYIVRASNGVEESKNSTMGFCVEKDFGAERPRHYLSIPMGFEDHTGDGELKASDLVMSIEGDLETSEYISDVVKWDYMSRGYSERYHYDGGTGEWIDDFIIEPGDGIGLSVENGFTWHINATDTKHTVHYGQERPRHYTSIPYTLADQTGDGQLMASDLVMTIEGDLETSEYIFDVVKWDHVSRGYSERYYYDGLAGEWTDDFVIEPGDGIAFAVKSEFTWDVELITPERSSALFECSLERTEAIRQEMDLSPLPQRTGFGGRPYFERAIPVKTKL